MTFSQSTSKIDMNSEICDGKVTCVTVTLVEISRTSGNVLCPAVSLPDWFPNLRFKLENLKA